MRFNQLDIDAYNERHLIGEYPPPLAGYM